MDAQTEIHHLITNRWSPRAFADKPVEPEKLRLLFDAAHWAASSGNEQPWRFLFAPKSHRAEFDNILAVLNESNQVWARNAPVIGFTFAKRTTTQTGKPNKWSMHDTGMALATLMLQASAMELYVHAMAGYDESKAREAFEVPEDFEVVAAFVVGYLGDASSLPEKLQLREVAPRSRKPLNELVFAGTFGHPAHL